MTTQTRRGRAIREAFGEDRRGGAGPSSKNAFPAYRVFIFGFEVTESVTAINVQNHVGKQPNSCSITLLNERDKYSLTTEDFFFLTSIDPSIVLFGSRDLGIEGLPDDPEESAGYAQDRLPGDDYSTGSAPESEETDFRLSNPNSVKSEIFNLKQSHTKVDTEVIDIEGNVEPFSVKRSRWPYSDGDPIFHPNDPVRVFVRDLFDFNKWYYAFSGLVTDIRDEWTSNNQKVLAIAAEDPTKLLRYARIVTNPGRLDAKDVTTINDLVDVSIWSSSIADMTLPQVVDKLIFGKTRVPPTISELGMSPPQGWETLNEDDLRRAIITSGLIKSPSDGETNEVVRSLGEDADTASLMQAFAASEQARIDRIVEEYRKRGEERDRVLEEAFPIENINRFGDRVERRYGLSGVGAFKPARESAVVDLLSHTVLGEHLVLSPLDRTLAEVAPVGDAPLSPMRLDPSGILRAHAHGAIPITQDLAAVAGPYLFSFGTDPEETVYTTRINPYQWDALISWEVKFSDLSTLLNKDVDEAEFRRTLVQKRSNILSDEVPAIENLITVIGTDPVNYPVDGGRVFMLIPVGAGELKKDVVDKAMATWNVRTAAINQNRLGLLYDVTERLEFQFYCTPKGDLVMEHPLYDYDPDDFELNEPRYIAELEDCFSVESTYSDSAVRTLAQVEVSISNYSSDSNEAQQVFRPVIVALPALFPTYGTRAEKENMRGIIQEEAAARLYGNILLNKHNADAQSVNLPMVPRFDLGLNRPVKMKARNHIGATKSVVHNMQWNGPWRTSVGLAHMRGWSGQLDSDNRMVYTPIGGANSRPLNYKVLFGRRADTITPDINQENKEERQGESAGQVRTERARRPRRSEG